MDDGWCPFMEVLHCADDILENSLGAQLTEMLALG